MTAEPDITDVLERYNCPHTVAVVRMRFWGAINSPAERISPIEEFDALWFGKRRRFENEDEAQAFYDVMIRFWNALSDGSQQQTHALKKNGVAEKPLPIATRNKRVHTVLARNMA